MKAFSLLLLAFLPVIDYGYAQRRETFDVITYVSPKGWKKTSTYNVVSFSTASNAKSTYCQMAIYKTTISKGSLAADFTSEWEGLIVTPYKPTSNPVLVPRESENGWDILSGSAPFEFNGGRSVAALVTISGYGRCMSLVVVSNTSEYQSAVEEFLRSIEMQRVESVESF
jgi:hypothetical protein